MFNSCRFIQLEPTERKDFFFKKKKKNYPATLEEKQEEISFITFLLCRQPASLRVKQVDSLIM